MRVFDKIDNYPQKSGQAAQAKKSPKQAEKPARLNLSPEEIRKRHFKHFNKDKVELSKKAAQKSESVGDMNLEKYIEKEPKDIVSDINLNDPTDSNTQEKLKSVIANGGFHFNTKERDVLAKILNQA